MLPEAELAFLDEVFQGSTAILNTLLGILNERTFRRGHTRMTCPLRVCVGADPSSPGPLPRLRLYAERVLRHEKEIVTAVERPEEPALRDPWLAAPVVGPDGVAVHLLDIGTGATCAILHLRGAQRVSVRLAAESLTASDDRGRVIAMSLLDGSLLRDLRI